ncbi:MAG: hypothetical protein LBN99_03160 [Oscillospiraceae bacterium]|jgi:hypothetical protein|nr:hypothetical protein [Oscillospiraceae bacterium]
MKVMKEKVRHHRFGAGAVVKQTETMVTVKFGGEYGEKKFLYPAAFETFLEFENPETQKEIGNEIRLLREQVEAEKRILEDENKQQLTEQRLVLTEQKRAAAKRLAASKRAPAKPKKTAKKVEEAAETEEAAE